MAAGPDQGSNEGLRSAAPRRPARAPTPGRGAPPSPRLAPVPSGISAECGPRTTQRGAARGAEVWPARTGRVAGRDAPGSLREVWCEVGRRGPILLAAGQVCGGRWLRAVTSLFPPGARGSRGCSGPGEGSYRTLTLSQENSLPCEHAGLRAPWRAGVGGRFGN